MKPLIRLPAATSGPVGAADRSHFQFIPFPSHELLYKAPDAVNIDI